MTGRRATFVLFLTLGALAWLAAAAPAANPDELPARITPKQANWKPAVRAARRYAERRQGQVWFAVSDMRGRIHHHGGSGTAPMASTFKVMLMVAYLRQRHVRNRALRDDERRLIKPMIRRSDDVAASAIDATLGRAPIERLAKRAGMRSFTWHDTWGLSRSSPIDQAVFMRELKRHVPTRHWDFARRQLARITGSQRWGIAKACPRGWKLYFKGGWGSGAGLVDHQIALLRREGRRVGVAIFTQSNPSHAYGIATQRGIARRLFKRIPR